MSAACCFKRCQRSPLRLQSAKIEVKSVIPSAGLTPHKDSFLVFWKKNGEATFHPECWTTLLSVARKRGSPGNRKRKLATKSSTSSEDYVMVQSEKVMIKEANKTVEKFDSDEEIKKKAIEVAKMIRNSKHCVFFTGAGISTSAGLGDFRGKGGKWTEQDREAIDIDKLFESSDNGHCEGSPEKIMRLGEGLPLSARGVKNGPHSKRAAGGSRTSVDEESTSKDGDDDAGEEEEEEQDVSYEELRPTLTHESISKLANLGHVTYLISQNCDGLHLLSGIPSDKISELHGNVFVEKCEKCETRYERSFYVCDDVGDLYLEELSDFGKTDIIKPTFLRKCHTCGLSHRTGRKCAHKNCRGFLMDTIINFGDNLEEQILDKAFSMSESCDLMVCLGSTLAVTPANELVEYMRDPQRVVICNRQPTEKDALCVGTDETGQPLGVRVFGDCDVFMRHVMVTLLGEKQSQDFLETLKDKTDVYNKKRKVVTSH